MKTAEEILKKLTPKYSSFPAFLENEHSVDVYDVVIEAMEEYASQKDEGLREELEIAKTYFELALSRTDSISAIKDGLNRVTNALKGE